MARAGQPDIKDYTSDEGYVAVLRGRSGKRPRKDRTPDEGKKEFKGKKIQYNDDDDGNDKEGTEEEQEEWKIGLCEHRNKPGSKHKRCRQHVKRDKDGAPTWCAYHNGKFTNQDLNDDLSEAEDGPSVISICGAPTRYHPLTVCQKLVRRVNSVPQFCPQHIKADEPEEEPKVERPEGEKTVDLCGGQTVKGMPCRVLVTRYDGRPRYCPLHQLQDDENETSQSPPGSNNGPSGGSGNGSDTDTS